MHERPDPQWNVYRGGDTPPESARDLLGDEAVQRFERYDPADPAAPEPVVIAGVDEQGQWLAGLLLLIERMEGEGGEAGETVASIQQLVIPPAHRGQGLAGRLIRRATTLAKAADATRLRSTAGWGCPDHLAMYARLRFDPLNARELPYLVSKPIDA
ncbi:MAG: GNAT family N-acetyltransferase [Phycisphaeraceae bacterium]